MEHTDQVQAFFDALASQWDNHEDHSEKEKMSLLKKVGLQPGDKVIDIACGTGAITGLIHQITQKEVYGIDLSLEMIKVAKEKYLGQDYAFFQQGDFLAFKEEHCFDAAIIYNAYPHFVSPQALSEKLFSVLKRHGKFAILHSLSREELNQHHAAIAKSVSRNLNDPLTEAKCFKDQFKILACGETPHSYFIIGKAK